MARMGLPAETMRWATIADLEAVPAEKVAEIIDGVLHVLPRPAIAHAHASSRLGVKLGGPFSLGEGGPGGWHILDEPELRFGPAGAEDVLVPDLAGWRTQRLPRLPRSARISMAPDWVCEVLSRRTESSDRTEKMPIYAREGVRHAWLIHPTWQTLEVFSLNAEGRWTLLDVHRGSARVRAEPFAEVELDLSLFWLEGEGEEAEGEEAEEAAPPPRSKPKPPKARKGKRK